VRSEPYALSPVKTCPCWCEPFVPSKRLSSHDLSGVVSMSAQAFTVRQVCVKTVAVRSVPDCREYLAYTVCQTSAIKDGGAVLTSLVASVRSSRGLERVL
jgi:hypothetical protein